MEGRFDKAQDKLYDKIYGAVAWPGAKPGFIVIVGAKKEPPNDIVVLDEREESDVRALVLACDALDYFYRPNQWLGDTENMAACEFIRELNAEKRKNKSPGRALVLRRSPVLDLKNCFSYVYPVLRKLLSQKHLFVKTTRLREYLLVPQASDIASIELGDFPSIEALSFGVLELDRLRESGSRPRHAKNDYDRFRV